MSFEERSKLFVNTFQEFTREQQDEVLKQNSKTVHGQKQDLMKQKLNLKNEIDPS